ncbi:MAG TPA: chemotaxis protein CheX [Terracidiphilus sp.]|jgi:CheY-specific phosphatase CheX|nr:chemotaxis protein CheX [Terracidiphilus sp.]
MQIGVDQSSIIKASSQFWEQMLAMKLDPMATLDGFCLGAGHVLGTVILSGAWSGSIEIRMDEGLTLQATAAMLMQSPESVQEADTLDAAKEISNMIAGGIKSSLPRPCAMTVPEAAVAGCRYCGAMRAQHSVAVAFRHDAGEMIVSVLMDRTNDETAPAARCA